MSLNRNIKAQRRLCTAAFYKQNQGALQHTQHSLCSSDPLDQSCTADLRLLSLFILCASAQAHPLPPPPFILLPPCFSSSLPHSFFFLLCHCSSMWRWADARVVRGNTPRAQHLGKKFRWVSHSSRPSLFVSRRYY